MAGSKTQASRKLLATLRDDDSTALHALAKLIVDDALDRPLHDLVEAERSAALIHEALSAWQQSDLAHDSISRNWSQLIHWLESQQDPLGEVLPQEFLDGATALAAQPFSPNRELLLALLDRPAFRQLIRELLVDTLISFGKRLRAPVAGTRLGKGLSGLGRMARSRSGGVGSLAGELVGVVSEGVERQLEGRATEFADGALSSILHKLADYLCEPGRAEEQAALRKALLEGLWQLTGAQVAAEMARGDVDAKADVMRRSLGLWLERPGAEEQLQGWLSEMLRAGEFQNLGELLDSLGLLPTVREQGLEQTEQRLQEIVAGDAFEQWLSGAMG